MKTLFLHVGFHKTGTSSIQSFLYNQRKRLLGHGVLYPKNGMAGPAHGALANALKLDGCAKKKQLILHNLNLELNSFTGDRVVISSECFMESINPKVIYDDLRQPNLNIKVVMYVRPQLAWAESLYNEIIKDSSRRYSGEILNMREIRRGDLNYYKVISLWAKAFGDENIIVRPFESKQMTHGLYHDFISVIGSDLLDIIELPQTGEVKNKSWDFRCVEFLRRINLIPMTRPMHREIVDLMNTLSPKITKFLPTEHSGHISTDTVKKIIELTGECNQLVADKWLGAAGQPLFNSQSWIGSHSKKTIELTSEFENWIFNQFPGNIQDHLAKYSPKISKRLDGEKFLPTPPLDEETRLRCEILRLRMELNWIYSK